MRLQGNLLNTIIVVFIFVALPLWALPLHDDHVVARENGINPRGMEPTPTYHDGALQKRFLAAIGRLVSHAFQKLFHLKKQ
jgi:hypothetical protein